MATQKTLVTALRPFAHGNVSAQAGQVYAMNPADAKELEKAGFVSMTATGDPEQTQADQPAQTKHRGDVVVDDAEDMLGDGKAAQSLDNKMAPRAANKGSKK